MVKYLVCIDFESTCDDNGWNKSNRMEIIEFAGIMTDINFNVIGEYDKFVQPILNPTLSDYCKNLTSIKQFDVDRAKTFDKVWEDFKEWMSKTSLIKDDFLFCSWGNYDEKQLRSDCELHNVQYPFNGSHCNLKDIVTRKLKLGKGCRGMEKVLNRMGLTLDGIHHRGIDDCRNILKICRKSNIGLREML